MIRPSLLKQQRVGIVFFPKQITTKIILAVIIPIISLYKVQYSIKLPLALPCLFFVLMTVLFFLGFSVFHILTVL